MLTRALADAGLDDVATVDSAGTTGYEVGRPIDERASQKLGTQGISSSAHRARRFEETWFGERDLILALNDDHYKELRALAPDAESRDKVRMLREFDPEVAGQSPQMQGIADPWYGDETGFDDSWDLIEAAIPGIVEHVRNTVNVRS